MTVVLGTQNYNQLLSVYSNVLVVWDGRRWEYTRAMESFADFVPVMGCWSRRSRNPNFFWLSCRLKCSRMSQKLKKNGGKTSSSVKCEARRSFCQKRGSRQVCRSTVQEQKRERLDAQYGRHPRWEGMSVNTKWNIVPSRECSSSSSERAWFFSVHLDSMQQGISWGKFDVLRKDLFHCESLRLRGKTR